MADRKLTYQDFKERFGDRAGMIYYSTEPGELKNWHIPHVNIDDVITDLVGYIIERYNPESGMDKSEYESIVTELFKSNPYVVSSESGHGHSIIELMYDFSGQLVTYWLDHQVKTNPDIKIVSTKSMRMGDIYRLIQLPDITIVSELCAGCQNLYFDDDSRVAIENSIRESVDEFILDTELDLIFRHFHDTL